MADQRRRESVIPVDVVIVGGGVQGLWLLNDLRPRCQAVLLERRELGGEQTCHSHVYIHEGHLYRELDGSLAGRLRRVRESWDRWLGTHTVDRGFEPCCFGYQNPGEASKKAGLWNTWGLPVTPMASVPDVLRGGAVKRAFETRERCLMGSSLVNGLRAGVESAITRVDEVRSMALVGLPQEGNRSQPRIVELSATIRGHLVRFQPGAVILAAGAHNQALIDLAAGGHRAVTGFTRAAQQIRRGHMLVVSGRMDRLPPLTGIFPDIGRLFIVSRVLRGADSHQVVWLVSDDRSPPVAGADDWLLNDARSWLERVLHSLRMLAPGPFAAAAIQELKWGVYAAPKAEGQAGGTLPEQPCVTQLGFHNLWAVWPTKLTLAPVASQDVTSQVTQRLGLPVAPGARRPSVAPLPRAWRRLRWSPDTAPERWEITPLVSWNEFKRRFGIGYV